MNGESDYGACGFCKNEKICCIRSQSPHMGGAHLHKISESTLPGKLAQMQIRYLIKNPKTCFP